MPKRYEDFNMDTRVLRLNILRGNTTQKDYEAYVKTLPDLSKKLIELPAYEEPSDKSEGGSGNLTFSVE